MNRIFSGSISNARTGHDDAISLDVGDLGVVLEIHDHVTLGHFARAAASQWSLQNLNHHWELVTDV